MIAGRSVTIGSLHPSAQASLHCKRPVGKVTEANFAHAKPCCQGLVFDP